MFEGIFLPQIREMIDDGLRESPFFKLLGYPQGAFALAHTVLVDLQAERLIIEVAVAFEGVEKGADDLR